MDQDCGCPSSHWWLRKSDYICNNGSKQHSKERGSGPHRTLGLEVRLRNGLILMQETDDDHIRIRLTGKERIKSDVDLLVEESEMSCPSRQKEQSEPCLIKWLFVILP